MLHLAVSSSLERDVISTTPSFVWQTHVSVLPGAGAHFVPVGSAEDGRTSTRLWKYTSKTTVTIAMILLVWSQTLPFGHEKKNANI